MTLSSIGDALIFTDHEGNAPTERRVWELAAHGLASIVAHFHDAIYIISPAKDAVSEGVIQTWNRGAELLYGYTAQEIIGKPVTVLIPADLLIQGREILARARKGEHVEPYDTRRLTKEGRPVEVSLSASPLKDARGRLIGVSEIARDITARKRAEAALRESEALKTGMLNAGLDAMITINQATEVLEFNAAAERIFGYARQDAIGKRIGDLIVPLSLREAHIRGVTRYLSTGESHILGRRIEISAMRSDGSEFPCELTVVQVPLEGPPLFTASLRDITERKCAEEALRRGALHDALTDLPNRAYFVERVSQALARMQREPGYRVAVLLLDCDGFKAVNDSLGHAAGDRLLMEIAGRLRKCVRPGDLVARLGGDEFTVLLVEITGVPDVEHAAQRIQDALAAPFVLQDREIITTASIGAAISEPDHEQPQDLLQEADQAMYHAKQRGRARFQLFDVGLRESAQARFDMEADLRTALERREFRLVFQPILELETGALRGFEALLRWQRLQRGVVMPVDFVALAEQTGLILPIGNWVLQEACRQCRNWQDELPVRISINLSARQLGHPDIVEEVRTAVQEAGLAPSCLILEIAERVLMENVASSKAVLHQLRELGVDVHMDNFGIAYSSLADLPLVPLQGIKVDRSLVHRMGMRRTDMEIVRSIVDLTKNLGLGVVAEGVETVAQRERLIAFGCELGQGHLFAKPLEAKAAGALLAKALRSDRRSA